MDQSVTPASAPTIEPAKPRTRRGPLGQINQRERAKLVQIDREIEAGKLVADLGGRAPTGAEAILIEQAAALIVDIRAARRGGRSTEDKVRLLTRIIGKLGFKSAAAKRAGPTLADLAALRAAPAAKDDQGLANAPESAEPPTGSPGAATASPDAVPEAP